MRRDEPEWRWRWQLDRLGFRTADETVNTPAGAADEAVAWVFGNICCCQHIFPDAPVAFAFYLLATVSVSLLLLYNNFDDGRYGTRRFGRVPVSSPCWKLRWISLLLTVECAHTHTHTQLLLELLTHPFRCVLLLLLALHFHACFVVLSELNCLLFNNIVLYDYVSKCLSLVCSLCTYVSFYLFITVLHTVLKWHGNSHTHSHTHRETYILLGAWLMAAYVACKCQLQILIVGHADKGLPTTIVLPHTWCVWCGVC